VRWRDTKEYRRWRIAVIRRDRRCKCCGTVKNRHAHHIEHATYKVSLRFDLDNGITLCKDCHRILHTKIAQSYRRECGFKELRALLYLRKYFIKMGESYVTENGDSQ
jgi:hypothetical protein